MGNSFVSTMQLSHIAKQLLVLNLFLCSELMADRINLVSHRGEMKLYQELRLGFLGSPEFPAQIEL
jgi:hypothetical protein